MEMINERSLETSLNSGLVVFKIKGTLAGKYVIIFIFSAENKNYINRKLANQLVILESNIMEKLDVWILE